MKGLGLVVVWMLVLALAASVGPAALAGGKPMAVKLTLDGHMP